MLMDGDAVYRIKQEERKDLLRQTAEWRLRRDAGLLYEMQLKRAVCRLLCQLGHALVALGKQLEQYGQPHLAAQ